MRKRSLKTQLSFTIALVSLITVALISFLSNYMIHKQFQTYISKQQNSKSEELIASIRKLYDAETNQWDINSVHTLGMEALNNGYIVKLLDNKESIIWDAEECDYTLCAQIRDEVTSRMTSQYPNLNGTFISNDYEVIVNDQTVGKIILSYYGPYFLSDSDFQFLSSLNAIFIGTGILSLLFSFGIGWFLSKKISQPISKTIEMTEHIAAGNYDISFEGETNTFELDALATSINQLSSDLKEQEKLRKQLTSDVAHELRTPLTSVATHLEMMIDGIWEPTTERLQSCHEEIHRITNIIKDLEKLERVESENLKLDKQLVDFKDILSTVAKTMEAELNRKQQTLSITGNVAAAKMDQDRMTQVVFNLLSNAVKYAPEHGKITLKLAETESETILYAKDNGSGIPEQELPYIFERFYRADKSRNRKTGGAGIGLTIAKSIVTAHGGTIEVESTVNVGSCFKVSIPK